MASTSEQTLHEQDIQALNGQRIVSTVIFDVDDTLYDINTGFTKHRHGDAVQRYMMEYLNFDSMEHARQVRDIYFERYHSTTKALAMAELENQFPPLDSDSVDARPRFKPDDLANYWANHLDYTLLGGSKSPDFVQDWTLSPLKVVAFSNGPRAYVKRVLQELGLWGNVFDEETLFTVQDTLPYCKPEPEAFRVVLDKIGVRDPSECVIIEDSMKNIRRAKDLGMWTVLITGANSQGKIHDDSIAEVGGVPACMAVDATVETVEDLRNALPGLWANPPVFVTAMIKADVNV
jgi:putative hydrolase of the HAD superfamily